MTGIGMVMAEVARRVRRRRPVVMDPAGQHRPDPVVDAAWRDVEHVLSGEESTA